MPRNKNLNVAVREWQDEVVFLHRSSRGRPTKATAFTWLGWPACRAKCWSGPSRSWPGWSRTTTTNPAGPSGPSAAASAKAICR